MRGAENSAKAGTKKSGRVEKKNGMFHSAGYQAAKYSPGSQALKTPP